MSHNKKSKDDTLDLSTLTIYGKSKANKGFLVALSKDETELLGGFLNTIHNGIIKVFEVDDLELVPRRDVIKKEAKDE